MTRNPRQGVGAVLFVVGGLLGLWVADYVIRQVGSASPELALSYNIKRVGVVLLFGLLAPVWRRGRPALGKSRGRRSKTRAPLRGRPLPPSGEGEVGAIALLPSPTPRHSREAGAYWA